jgi:hypothetical protein
MRKFIKCLSGTAILLTGVFLISTSAFATPCKPGKDSTGKQSWGGSGGGRLELVCDESSVATCCYSDDNKSLSE